MAAPTPVSSLVHSSTLVTAGVYLILRFFYSIHSLIIRKLLSLIFILTTLLAGLIACFEPDLKKVVAISTLSQLGLILYILSLGEVLLCYYHIVCHALFRALLFLRCGMIISLRGGGQDIRFMGGLRYILPGVSLLLGISSLSLFGFPFFAGFYSKDLILERIFFYEEYTIFVGLLIFCCILTAVYSYRLFLVGLSSCRIGGSQVLLDEGALMIIGIRILSIWSIVLGSVIGYIIFINSINMPSLFERGIGIIIVSLGLMIGGIKVWN